MAKVIRTDVSILDAARTCIENGVNADEAVKLNLIVLIDNVDTDIIDQYIEDIQKETLQKRNTEGQKRIARFKRKYSNYIR